MALEEVAALLATREDKYKKKTNIVLNEIAASTISPSTGISVPPNKAVVGGDAFHTHQELAG